MDEYRLREAFQKIKDDMSFLHQEIEEIKRTLQNITTQMKENQSFQHSNPTINNIPTHNYPLEAPKSQNKSISIGNEGVPTNQQTIQPTNQHPSISTGGDKIDHLKRVSEILGSLDELKKEVRIKFKKLTNQEMLIYSTIYQLEEEGFSVDYSLIAGKLGLTEISIRDYIRKIINKGIPLDKIRENNKKIILSIPLDLKQIASLNTIIQLREL